MNGNTLIPSFELAVPSSPAVAVATFLPGAWDIGRFTDSVLMGLGFRVQVASKGLCKGSMGAFIASIIYIYVYIYMSLQI